MNHIEDNVRNLTTANKLEQVIAPSKTYNFSEALELMKNGSKMQRLGWNSKDMYCFLSYHGWRATFNEEYKVRLQLMKKITKLMDEIEVLPCFILRTTQGKLSFVWRPTNFDILSEDWIEI